jgi:hypothetical protein
MGGAEMDCFRGKSWLCQQKASKKVVERATRVRVLPEKLGSVPKREGPGPIH